MRPVKKKLKATPTSDISKEELKAPPSGELKAPPSDGESRRKEFEASHASGSSSGNGFGAAVIFVIPGNPFGALCVIM